MLLLNNTEWFVWKKKESRHKKNPILQLQKKNMLYCPLYFFFLLLLLLPLILLFISNNQTTHVFQILLLSDKAENVKVGRFISQRIESVDVDNERARSGEENERRSKQQNLFWFNTRRCLIAAVAVACFQQYSPHEEDFCPLLLWGNKNVLALIGWSFGLIHNTHTTRLTHIRLTVINTYTDEHVCTTKWKEGSLNRAKWVYIIN